MTQAEKARVRSSEWYRKNKARASLKSSQHYQMNRAQILERVEKRSQSRRQIVWEAKQKPCAECGNSYPPYVMDFDHRDSTTKRGHISDPKIRFSKLEKLLAEIKKCDVVCANCHRERTARQQNWHHYRNYAPPRGAGDFDVC